MRGALYPSRPGSRRIETSRSVAKPGLNASRALARLRTNRPPATSTTTEIDNCATTSAFRSVSRRAPWLLPLSPGLSDGTRSVRTACQAGASPKTRPVASDSASPQPSTRRSGVKSSVMGSCTLAGIAAPSRRAVQNVSATASLPPRAPAPCFRSGAAAPLASVPHPATDGSRSRGAGRSPSPGTGSRHCRTR